MKVRTGLGAWALVVSVLACAVPAASADTIYLLDGKLSTASGGVVGYGSWNGVSNRGFEISYEITHDPLSNLVTYYYEVSGVGGTNLSKDLSHFIIETSTSFTHANLFAGTTPDGELRSTALGGKKTTWAGETNTAGIKWDTQGDPATASFTIVSDRQPMLGTFYAKSGNGTYAMADGLFYVPDTDPVPSNPVPVVPLPAAAWAGALLLMGLGVRHIRRRRQND